MKILTDAFKVNIAQQFYEGFNESANTIYYAGAHRSVPFADDIQIPDPVNTQKNVSHEIYNELIFVKHITPADVAFMVKNNQWQSGTVYDKYDDLDDNLQSKIFYVV